MDNSKNNHNCSCGHNHHCETEHHRHHTDNCNCENHSTGMPHSGCCNHCKSESQEHADCKSKSSDHGHCHCACDHDHHSRSKIDLIFLTASIVLFAISFAFPHNISATLKLISSALCGYKILYHGIKSLFKIQFNENTLMAVAALASVVMEDFNEAYLIVLLFGIGQYLEEYAINKSYKQIENLMSSTDEFTYDEKGTPTKANTIKKGDKILFRPGDKLCTDAKIIKGTTSVDTSNLTGESIPKDVVCGDLLPSGYINLGSAVLCEATCDYNNSTTAKIKDYVEKARNKKSSTEKFITKFAKIYTPAVIIAAMGLGVMLFAFGITDLNESVKRALTFMIASCPCALVISIPLSYYAAIGSAGKNGILIKGSRYIDSFAKSDAIAFDKTGTLTNGKLVVTQVTSLGDKTQEEILGIASALEKNSSHPIAKAICKAAEALPQYAAEEVREIFGKGIEGKVNNQKITIGNRKLTEAENNEIGAGLVVCIDGALQAVIYLSDTIKEDASQTLAELKKCGIKSIYMLSGDNNDVVKSTCQKIGNISGKGELLPEDKANYITKLKKSHRGVIYVGDGVNDAPALTVADFSISVGSGASLSLESGDATLISHSLSPITSVFKIAKHTMKVVYTNILFSLSIKALVLIFATVGIAPIWLALFADVGVLIIAVLNSLSILYKKF